MDNIGFAKLNQMGKIKLVLHLLSKQSDEWYYGQIRLFSDMSGSIGYEDYDGHWQSSYKFYSEVELERTLLEIYEELRSEEK